MDIIVLDGLKTRRNELTALLEKNRHKVVSCSSSNDFMTAVSSSTPTHVCVDVESWHQGRAMYSYFDIGKKLEAVPVVFYNAPQNFTALPDRPRNEKDYVLTKPTEVEAIAEALSNTL